jgi:hypothetical protein
MIGLGVNAVRAAGKKAYDTVSPVGDMSGSFEYSITGEVAKEADIPDTIMVKEPTGMSVASIEPTTKKFRES